MHDALENTFDRWWRDQAGGAGLRIGLSGWSATAAMVTPAGPMPPTATLSLSKSHVFADRYVPGVLEETRLILPMRLGLETADSGGTAVWRDADGDRPLSDEELATLFVLAVRQSYHRPPRAGTLDPGFAALTHWMLTALDADDGTRLAAIKTVEPRAFWWWGRVLQQAGQESAAERAWLWQVEGGRGGGPPDAAVRSLQQLTELSSAAPADRLGLCRRAQRIFDDTGFRDFDLQTALDLARSEALIDLGYWAQGLESLDAVDRRLVANPCAGALRQTTRVTLLTWRAGGVWRAVRATADLAAGVLGSSTARFKLRKAWSIRRLRSRNPRLPRGTTLPTGGDAAAGPGLIRRIALVRLDKVGDLVTIQPIVAAIHKKFPDAAIDLHVTAGLEALVPRLAHNVRGVGINWKNHTAFEQALNHASQAPAYDLLIDLLEPDTARHARLTRALRATYKVGFDSPARRETFTHRVPAPRRPMHLIQRTAWLLRPLGIAIPEEVDWRPTLSLTADQRDAGRAMLGQAFGVNQVIGIHVGAGWRFKRWYPESFAAVGRSLVEGLGVKVAVFAGPGEEAIAQRVASAIGASAAVLRPTLDQLPGVFAACDLMLVNDSGPMHVAVAVGAVTVVAWGPGDRTLFAPRGEPGQTVVVADQPRCANCPQEVESSRCPMGYRYEAVPCLQSVTVPAVTAACLALWERRDGVKARKAVLPQISQRTED